MEVKPFIVYALCDFCGDELHSTGSVLCSMPPKYPHKCNSCGNEENLDKNFPTIEYKPINL